MCITVENPEMRNALAKSLNAATFYPVVMREQN